jgi:hypothetical protein
MAMLRAVYRLYSKGTAALYLYFHGAVGSFVPRLNMKTIELVNSILQNSPHATCLACHESHRATMPGL